MDTAHNATRIRRYAGPAELLELLNVGRTRLATLTHRGGFPAPVATPRMGKIWDLDQILTWTQDTGRTVRQLAQNTAPSGPLPANPVGAAELLQLLGVSPTRLAVLTRRPDFPTPVITLRIGTIWDLADIRHWAAVTGRTLHQINPKP